MISFKSLYYHLRYGRRNHKTYQILDVLKIYLEEIGIKSVSSNLFYCTIIFNDDTNLEFWNGNRWYAWMMSGSIEFSNGKKLKWSYKMPSNEVLFKYKRVVKKYEKSQKEEEERNKIKTPTTTKNQKIVKSVDDDDDNDYSEYLPLKLARKIKLENLKK